MKIMMVMGQLVYTLDLLTDSQASLFNTQVHIGISKAGVAAQVYNTHINLQPELTLSVSSCESSSSSCRNCSRPAAH